MPPRGLEASDRRLTGSDRPRLRICPGSRYTAWRCGDRPMRLSARLATLRAVSSAGEHRPYKAEQGANGLSPSDTLCGKSTDRVGVCALGGASPGTAGEPRWQRVAAQSLHSTPSPAISSAVCSIVAADTPGRTSDAPYERPQPARRVYGTRLRRTIPGCFVSTAKPQRQTVG